MNYHILFFSFLTLMGPLALAQSATEKEVAAAVETLRKGMVDGDRTALEKIAADALSYGHSSGKIENKASFVETLTSGKSDFTSITLSEQTTQIVDNTALVRHKFHAETNDGGNPGNVALGILLVWQKQKGGWKLIARQAYKL
jgi:ketosteroid isomerase-like protein